MQPAATSKLRRRALSPSILFVHDTQDGYESIATPAFRPLPRSSMQARGLRFRGFRRSSNNNALNQSVTRYFLVPRRGPCECRYFSVLEESGDAQSFRTVLGLSKSNVPTFFRQGSLAEETHSIDERCTRELRRLRG
jgi:hypothetical protein